VPDLPAPAAGDVLGRHTDAGKARGPGGDEPVDQDDGIVERADAGQVRRRDLRGRDAGPADRRDVVGIEQPAANPDSRNPAHVGAGRDRELDVVVATGSGHAPQHRCARTADHRTGHEQSRRRDGAHLVRDRPLRTGVDVAEQAPPRRAP
jgi:hypothetical protein